MNTIRSEFKRLGFKKSSNKDSKQFYKMQEEKLSKRELEDLMGMNKQTYKRGKGGAIRSR